MNTRTAASAAMLILATLTAGCSSGSGGDTQAGPADCKAAMRKQLQDAIDTGASAAPGSRPPQCDGIDNKTLQKFTGELMADQVSDALNSALPTETTTTSVSPECRAWIKDELLSTGGGIDAVEGYSICGKLPEEALNQAIEEVTNELIQQGATASP
ncbi:hypothetical protein ACWD5F_04810 [Streptomyces sp. NPDC002499]